jgi:hypothetical protein
VDYLDRHALAGDREVGYRLCCFATVQTLRCHQDSFEGLVAQCYDRSPLRRGAAAEGAYFALR